MKQISLLKSGAELLYQKTWWGNTEAGNLFINTGDSPEKPDKLDAVIKIVLKK